MLNTEQCADRTMVMLKVTLGAAAEAAARLHLAPPLLRSRGEVESYWYGPDCWILASDDQAANDLVEICNDALDDVLHSAVDCTSALTIFRLSGSDARDVLASGTGIDLRSNKFKADSCYRTRLAGVTAFIVANGEDKFELMIDRSYAGYLKEWLSDTQSIVKIAAAS